MVYYHGDSYKGKYFIFLSDLPYRFRNLVHLYNDAKHGVRHGDGKVAENSTSEYSGSKEKVSLCLE